MTPVGGGEEVSTVYLLFGRTAGQMTVEPALLEVGAATRRAD